MDAFDSGVTLGSSYICRMSCVGGQSTFLPELNTIKLLINQGVFQRFAVQRLLVHDISLRVNVGTRPHYQRRQHRVSLPRRQVMLENLVRRILALVILQQLLVSNWPCILFHRKGIKVLSRVLPAFQHIFEGLAQFLFNFAQNILAQINEFLDLKKAENIVFHFKNQPKNLSIL